MTLSIIVAMTEDRVIGRNNTLPWHLSEDLVRFKKITMGHPIIMGRRTYDSIGKPLPGRTNVVVTRNRALNIDGVLLCGSLADAVASQKGSDEIFVIGGASLFDAALPIADKLYLTLIHETISGDTYFPMIDLKKDFIITESTDDVGVKADKLKFSFITAVRKK